MAEVELKDNGEVWHDGRLLAKITGGGDVEDVRLTVPTEQEAMIARLNAKLKGQP